MVHDDRAVAIYIRVSTDEQALEGHSLIEQEEQLREFAKAMGWSEVRVYKDDGYSAKNLARPQIQHLIRDVESNRIKGVLTTRIDRLSRKNRDFSYLIDVFNDNRCFYRSVKQDFEINTTTGKLIAQILSVFAEFERDLISERVYENLSSKAKKGEMVSRPPYGYQIVDGQLALHPVESAWVRRAADLLLSGQGSRAVAKYLNDMDVPSKNGRRWSDSSIRTLFKNPVLTGQMRWNRYKGTGSDRKMRDEQEWIVLDKHHPKIIEMYEFQTINEMFQRRTGMSVRGREGARLLSDLAFCGFCGGKMHAGWQIYYRDRARTKKVKKKTYRCGTYATKGECRINRVDAEELDCFVIKTIMNLRSNHDERNVPMSRVTTLEDEITLVKRRIHECDQRINRFFDSLGRGTITDGEFRRQRELVQCEKADYETRLRDLQELQTNPDAAGVVRQEFLNKVRRLDVDFGGDEKAQRAVVERLVDRVIVFRENAKVEPSIKIQFRV